MVTTAENSLVLYLQYPDGKTSSPMSVTDESEAKRLVYFHNRLFITEKLKNFFNQRLHAFGKVNAGPSYTIANTLLLNLTVFQQRSLHRLCEWVAKHESDIRLIAPRGTSQHYKFYSKTILPILAFCAEMTEVPASC